MRTNKFLVVSVAICLAATIGMGFSSCKKDEPTPVIVENPLDAEVYYISGKVTYENKALDGVKVSASAVEATTDADGNFLLAMASKSSCVVSFEKSGFVTVTAEVEFPADAEKQSVVSLVQDLETKNPAVTVTPEAAQTVSEAKNNMVELAVPAGAVKSATDISVTAYKEGAKKVQTGTLRASLSTVSCEPDGQKFEKPVELRMKNPTSGQVYFASVKHYVETNGVWTETGAAGYDSDGYYVTMISGFSNHSFGVSCSSQKGASATENLKSVVLDNLGDMNAKAQTIDVTQHIGWKIDGAMSDLLKNQLAGLSDSDAAALADIVENTLASLMGGSPAVSEMPLKWNANISGDMKTTVSVTEKTTTTSFGFPVVFGGRTLTLTVPVVKYEGVNMEVTTEKGASHGGHSGGLIE
ncbi:carboxypeptidase-like regulatory domain-containing protein [Parabacteroides sp.]